MAGKLIPITSFKLAPEVGRKVYKVDLKQLGLMDYGELESGELGACTNNKMELFYNNEPMVLARHPNILGDGMWQWMQIENVVNSSAFTFNCSKADWGDVSTLWLHGYWKYDWADNYVHVLQYDASSCTVHLDPKTPVLYELTKGARFYALNLLHFLDSPFEYYIDRKAAMLYFFPATLLETGPAYLSVGQYIVNGTGVSHVVIQNLNMYFSRSTAIEMHDVDSVQLSGFEVANHGATSVLLYGSNSQVYNLVIAGNGCGGLHVSGGDQKLLTRGNNTVSGCNLSRWSRWKRTYQPGLSWGGVGNTYTKNEISNGPHSGILGGGNDCTFTYNLLSTLCYEATDSGGFYTGRSWIDRGNVIAHNVFKSIRATENVVLGAKSVQAIYLDDQMSGYDIYNNTFIDCFCGSFIGGGRRNKIHENMYINCSTDVHIDNRGMNWQNANCKPGGMFDQQLQSVNYQQPPWSTHYPELVNIFKDHPCIPVYNEVENNVYCNADGKFIDATSQDTQKWMDTVKNNTENCHHNDRQ
ncbi:uncharacterized protein LOC134197826 isoform X2 [Corticium candelabrum]|nr:uncharacterized protein LOC134197826 isoform X2 [Corticium candelabrum]